MTREQRLKLNSFSSLFLQLTTVVCGFILPKMILGHYGSEINGLNHSISQFLSIITFLELGVGTVVQSALYKPLAQNDKYSIDCILTSATKFFRVLGYIFFAYVIILTFIYPVFTNTSFSSGYLSLLVVIFSISSFSQYYFGIVDRLLLLADQRGYIFYLLQAATIIANTLMSALLINMNVEFHILKIATLALFFIWPIVNKIYVKKRYNPNRKIKYQDEPIKQKWNGIAQHIAAVVLDGTDVIVLTVICGMAEVSVYSIYNMVVMGIRQLVYSTTNGLSAYWGSLIANEEWEKLYDDFDFKEWLMHSVSTLLFGCTCILIVPFVRVYTLGVTDANYIQPLFAVILTLAQAFRCIRLPYNVLILSGNHYKQTQNSYIVAAMINIVTSVLLVFKFGLIGVAIGTAIAMLYQTLWMVRYDYTVFLKKRWKQFIKQCIVDAGIALIATGASVFIPLAKDTFSSWIILAIEVSAIWFLVSILLNVVLYKENMKRIVNPVICRIKR